MKSPVKINWFLSLLPWLLAGLFGDVGLFILNIDIISNVSVLRGIVVFSIVPFFFILLGALITYSTRRQYIFHRHVDYPVNPKTDLVKDAEYFLNGRTWAYYRGQDEVLGKYYFSIYGLNDIENPKDVTVIYGYRLVYISAKQEVFSFGKGE